MLISIYKEIGMKKIVIGMVFIMVSAALFAQNNIGNDFATGSNSAQNVTPGTVLNATLQQNNSYWYRIAAPGGILTVFTDSNIDTTMRLYNTNGEEIEYNDDGGIDLNARISRFVPAGTYFIRVSGYGSASGPFSLHVNVISPPVTVITPGTVHNATLQANAEHMYQLTVSGGVFTIYTDSNIDTVMWLYNAAGDELAYNDDGGIDSNARISRFVPAGTYFIRVKGYSEGAIGPYSLHTLSPPVTDITPGTVHNATLQANAEHMYRVTLPQGRVTLFTDSNIDTVMWLYDADGNELAYNDDGGTDNNALISHYCAPGTYFIRVGAYNEYSTGPYSLHIQTQ